MSWAWERGWGWVGRRLRRANMGCEGWVLLLRRNTDPCLGTVCLQAWCLNEACSGIHLVWKLGRLPVCYWHE
jgi:hypothetical protein